MRVLEWDSWDKRRRYCIPKTLVTNGYIDEEKVPALQKLIALMEKDVSMHLTNSSRASWLTVLVYTQYVVSILGKERDSA